MRQETGSNIPQSTKDVISVRVHHNGDAFVLPEVKIAAGVGEKGRSDEGTGRSLGVELLSKRTMLIPREMLDGDVGVARREYAAAGMSICEGEELLVVGEGDIVALVALSKSLIADLQGRCVGGKVCYSSPLVRGRVSDGAHVVVDVVDGLSFVKIYSSSELLLADVFETSNAAQVEYWLQSLSTAMSLSEYDLYILRGDEGLSALVGSSFKRVCRCE